MAGINNVGKGEGYVDELEALFIAWNRMREQQSRLVGAERMEVPVIDIETIRSTGSVNVNKVLGYSLSGGTKGEMVVNTIYGDGAIKADVAGEDVAVMKTNLVDTNRPYSLN